MAFRLVSLSDLRSPRAAAAASLILAAAASRLLPHPPNVTPIAAMALFSGARLPDRRLAYALPLAAMLLSDLVIGFHVQQPVVYFLFLLIVGIGRRLRGRPGATPIAAAAPIAAAPVAAATIAASVLFFVGTNLSVWLFQPLYPKTADGLAACFLAALPFFRNTILGDAAFAAALFGGFALVERRLPALRPGAGWAARPRREGKRIGA